MSLDRVLARMCQDSYDGQFALTSLDIPTVYEASDKETDTQAYVCFSEDEKDIYIVFRGSSSLRDWVQDFKIDPITWHGYQTHKGFVQCIESVIQEIVDLILPHANSNIYITGHSLGGALALLCGLIVPLRVKKIVTFGQPKTIEKSAKGRLRGAEYVRYVNHGDAVTKLPFELFKPYRHFGEMMYINSNGKLVSNPHYIYKFIDSVWSWEERLTDHFIGSYVPYIR